MINVNLAHWRQKQLKQRSLRLIIYLLLTFLFFCSISILSYYYYQKKNKKQKIHLESINTQINRQTQLINTLKELQLNTNQYTFLQQQLTHLSKKKLTILHFFTCLTQVIPDAIWLEKANITEQQIILDGNSINYLPIVAFYQSLNNCQITNPFHLEFIEVTNSFSTEEKQFMYRLIASWNNHNEH